MPEEEKKKKPPKVINNKFEIQRKLGAGCFGEVYMGKNRENSSTVAIKVEDFSAPAPQLEQEFELLKQIKGDQPQLQGFVEVFYFGKENSKDGCYNCLVMELLGKSLEDMVQHCKGKFNAKTTSLIAQQVILRIEFLHSRGFVHRDIKPENFMFGYESKIHHIYIIDFGLSKRYWDKKHCVQKSKLSLTGTARYASINAHKGVEQSRRDDLEAIGHMFMYFLRGSVPWSGLDAKTKQEKYRKIMEKKEQFPLDELCKGFPVAFQEFLQTARHMEFMERPRYDDWKEQFKKVSKEQGAESDYDYQWFDGRTPQGNLIPLAKPAKIRQPDDPEEVRPQQKKGGGLGCCMCSRNTPVRERHDEIKPS